MRSTLILIFILISGLSYAQTDTLWLDPINVQSDRISVFSPTNNIIELDSTLLSQYNGQSLAHTLRNASTLNIRSYGVGGLSTASSRGTGSNHTSLIWEGINIQSPMNGSVDLSQIPTTLFSNTQMISGGNSSMFGSGAMGGSILIEESTPRYNSGISSNTSLSAGSYGQHQATLNTSYGGANMTFSVSGVYKEAANNFEFYNRYDRQNEKREHNATTNQGLILSSTYKFNNKHELQAKYWFQDNYFEIPLMLLVNSENQAIQRDRFNRAIIRYNATLSSNTKMFVSGAYLNHTLDYNNHVNIHAVHKIESWIAQARVEKHLKLISLEAGVNPIYDRVKSDNLGNEVSRSRTALYASGAIDLDRTNINLSVRQELNNTDISPFMPSLAISQALSGQFKGHIHISKNYKVPNLNDTHWVGNGAQGNPDLSPEEGWSYETGLSYEKKTSRCKLKKDVTLFYINIRNWITWTDQEGTWTPQNLDELWSYGVEYTTQATFNISNHNTINLNLNYQWNQAAIERPSNKLLDATIAAYSPEHSLNLSMTLNQSNWGVSIFNNYTGKQYTDASNNELRALDPFNITDLSAYYRIKVFEHSKINLTANINNTFNKQYEVRRGYPMPGINYLLGLNYSFN